MKPGGGIGSASRFHFLGTRKDCYEVSPRGNVVQSEAPYFRFLGVFAFSVLTFRFAVFPGGTHPQPQFIFFDIMSPPFVLSVFLPPPIVGIRRCNAWRSPAGAGTPGSVSPPS